MTRQERKDWDDLIVSYGKQSGVKCWGKMIRLHASREGCTATVPRKTFERLRREGRIAHDGQVLEYKTICL